MDEDKSADEPDNSSAESDEENLTQKQLQEILNRINYMERVLRDQLSRLYEIEMRMGFTPTAFQAPPRQPGQPTPPLSPAERPTARRPFEQPPSRSAQPAPPQNQAPSARQPGWVPPVLKVPGVESRVNPAEQQAGIPPQSQTSPSILEKASEQEAHSVHSEQARQTAPPVPSGQTYSTSASQTPRVQPSSFPPPAPPKNHGDLETRIGGNWLGKIGVVAIVLAVGYFLKFAFDNDWITPTYQVWTGIIIGVAFLAAGEWLRKKYATYAYGLTGGGILILYLSAWASSKLYDVPVFEPMVAFVFMALITALASLLAARYNTLIIAILGFIGGFLTPILLSTGVDNEAGLFGYITLLDLGVLALAFKKQWRSLNYLSFAATVLMVAAWMGRWYAPEKLWTTIIFLTIFFAIYALLAILHNVVNKRPTIWLDLAMVFVNAMLYFGTTYLLLNDWRHSDRYHAYLGAFAVLMAAFYGMLGYFTYQRDSEDRLLIFTFCGLAFLFLVLAVPIQFDQQWVTMAWALEGAIMTWVGLRVKDRTSLYASLCVFGIAVFHWLSIDAAQFGYQAGKTFVLLLNNRALSCAVLVASLAAASWFYKRFGSHVKDDERGMFSGLYLLGANIFAITLLSLDVNSYFEQKQAATNLALTTDESQRISNTHMFTLSVLWGMYGATALFIGIMRQSIIIRIVALLLLAVTALKVLATDLWYYDSTWHTTIFNQTFASLAVVIAAFACGAWLYSRSENIRESERKVILPLLIGAANVLALIALSAEVIGHFNRGLSSGSEYLIANHLEETKQFVLSALWTLYAAAALTLGIKRRSKLLRLGAVLLLAVTIFKLILVDLNYYNSAWHTLLFNRTFGAFVLMIAALAAGGWLYARAEEIEEEERFAILQVIIVVANLLALVALSAEAWGYYGKKISEITTAAAADFNYEKLSDLKLAQQLSLSVLWTIYGGAMLTIGIMRRSQLLRIMALLLLGLAILKVFFIDLASLAKVYRIISLFVLGAILLAVSFLYQRFRFLFVDAKDDAAKTVTNGR